ncbi:MAG: UDP-N-acetylmuramoyl-tripeptide--D-alanyl-D-alanine ligase [Clostridium sp.]|nr:UDP-N-acetylmuramoyl-tripeptide--D-alanyl-D-alanine ligase [Clostridium sp.]
MIAIAISAILLVAIAAALQIKRQLMMFQQNSYRPDRYALWYKESKESTKPDRLIALILLFACFAPAIPRIAAAAGAIIFALWAGTKLIRAKYKKPLVFTKRAIRIYALSLLLEAAVICIPLLVTGGGRWTGLIGCLGLALASYAVSVSLLLLANWILIPVEKHITKKYYDQAAGILRQMPDLKIIGVTGSYGKTSTKHYLHRILSEQFDVAMTPGNFNTTLGVVRTIRENLKPYNQVFIVEMGAKQVGDIKEICDLAHPQIGIVTAVGPMHLESFGSIDNVQRTKFELVDALPADGLAIVNNDFEKIADRKVDNVECLRYTAADAEGSDYWATDIKYGRGGTTFTICDKTGPIIELSTPLVGRCNVSNLIAATITALRLGVPAEKIKYAVSKIQQVEHRLSLKRLANGVTIIDDAYNSNPQGSAMALEVLSGFAPGKRIVITPGMVELGEKQYELNAELGENIARNADVAIIVGEYNREAILEGINRAGMPKENVREAATFNEANAMMLQLASAGDAVLIENDLPDTFK